MLGPALTIAGKDFRQRLRDRSAILIAIVAPLVLASIFGLTLSGVSDESITFDYAVADLDRGPVAKSFVDDVLGGVQQAGYAELRGVPSAEEARRLADEGDVAAAFVLPAGFSAAVANGRPARLQVIGDPDAPIGTLVARSIADSFASDVRSVEVAVATAAAGGAARPPAELADRAAAVPRPVAIEDVSATKKELDPTTFYAAGMAVFFLFFTVQFGVSSLLDERREGTLRRLLAAPISRTSILAGKLTTSFVLGIVSMAVLIATTSFLLGAEWGSPLGVAVLVVAGVLAATGAMALVATLAKTPEQAGYWQSIVALVLGLLGGAFFPVAQAGGLMEKASLLTPHAWFLRGLGDLAGGAGPASVLPAAGAILLFAMVTGTVALLRLGKLVEP